MLLLAAVTLAALSTQAKAPASARCPQAPYAVPQAVGPTPATLTCPALEVSGRADRTNPSLDPAFDDSIAPGRFPQSAPATPEGLLQGLDAQGHIIFAQTMNAGGDFHTYVPLPEGIARALVRLRLTIGTSVTERGAAMHGEPSAETVSVDSSHVLLAWNGSLFPAVRVRENPAGPLVAVASGSSTYDEVTVNSTASVLVLEFSDGVRSVTRTVRVFGR